MLNKASLKTIGFLQALGMVTYTSLVGFVMWRGNDWFGPLNSPIGPILIVSLFVVSALISALITLGYPFILFWIKKKPKSAFRLVIYTTSWLAGFVILVILYLTLR